MVKTFDGPLDDDEEKERLRLMAVAAEKAKETAKAAAVKAAEAQAEKQKKEEEAKAAEAKAWEEAKVAAAEREARKAQNEEKNQEKLSPGELMLQAIDMLAAKASESDEHEQRCERLEKVSLCRACTTSTIDCSLKHVLSTLLTVMHAPFRYGLLTCLDSSVLSSLCGARSTLIIDSRPDSLKHESTCTQEVQGSSRRSCSDDGWCTRGGVQAV